MRVKRYVAVGVGKAFFLSVIETGVWGPKGSGFVFFFWDV